MRFRITLAVVVLLWGMLPASALDYYVQAGASGNGTAWNNALGTLPGNLVRGATYYVGSGNYGQYRFTSADSGTISCTVRKATATDHGTDTGWQAGYASQAVFSLVGVNGNYFVFDGMTGGGPGSWTSGYGFKINATGTYPGVFLGESQFGKHHITLRHFEVEGDHGDGAGGGLSNDAVSCWGGCGNVTISHAYLHDVGRCLFKANATSNVVIESIYGGKYESTDGEHAEISSWEGDDVTFRNNVFTHLAGTGGLMFNGDGNYVYGNVFYHAPGDTSWDYAANGIIGAKSNNEPVSNCLVYNNTFINTFSNGTGGGGQVIGMYMPNYPGNVVKNNLFYGNNVLGPIGSVTHDYNLFVDLSGSSAPTEAHGASATGNPFNGYQGLDFTLVANTAAGADLGSPYDRDARGQVRSSWTRGAYEFVPTGSQPPAPATRYCVRAGATGAGNGSDWANAFPSLPGTLLRGATYYLADGTYAGRTLGTAASGATLITVKKATVSDHGVDAGWSGTYGDGQATFTSAISFGSSYWVFDGVNGSLTTNPGAYGFAFTQSNNAIMIGTADGQNLTDIRISHVYADAVPGDTGKDFIATWGQIGSTNRITISHNFADHWQCHLMVASPNENSHGNYLLEYNLFMNGFSSPLHHGEMIDANYGGMQKPVFRYNIFRGSEGSIGGQTGTIVANNSDITEAEVYGNIFEETMTGNGIVTGTSVGGLYNSKIYNNTFLNASPDSGAWVGGGQSGGNGNVAYNNLCYNMRAVVGSGVVSDYNAYFNTTNSPSETHKQTGSGDPFTNYVNGTYALRANTTAGTPLPAPYNVDMVGNIRTTWTRGAIEYVAPTSPGIQVPTVSAQPLSVSVAAGQTATFTVTASGSPTPTYQWQRNGVAISGATAASYTTSATTTADNGAAFRVVVSNSAGSVPSSVATLTVSSAVPSGATESIWGPLTGPSITNDGSTYELGTVFTAIVSGQVRGIRVYAAQGEAGAHIARLWNNATGAVVGGPYAITYAGPGWYTYALPTPIAVSANTAYTVSVSTGGDAARAYVAIQNALASAGSNGADLRYPANAGVYTTVLGARPMATYLSSNYLRDVVFTPDTTAPTVSGTGLTGTYFDNRDFTGPTVQRIDATIDFAWGSGSPATGIGADTFSVRWRGQVLAQYSQTYTFFATGDDGVRLWVNGQQLINQWKDQGASEYSGSIALTAGQKYDLVLEYYENSGAAVAKLAWSSASTTKQVIPKGQLYPAAQVLAALPAGWAARDVGSVGLAGSTTYVNGTFTISGSGDDIWNSADAFQFASQALTGDGSIMARVVSVQNTDGWAKAGVMIREGTTAGAKHVFCCVTAGNGVAFQQRMASDGSSSHTAGSTSIAPRWVKLVRQGAALTGYESADGSTWTVVGSTSISLTNPVQIGLAVTSHNSSARCSAVFDRVLVMVGSSG